MAELIHFIGGSFMSLYIAVPSEYVGGVLKVAGWCKSKLIAAFCPEDMSEDRILDLLLSLNQDKTRTMVRLKPETECRFRKRLTGPDCTYQGIWASFHDIHPHEYEIAALN